MIKFALDGLEKEREMFRTLPTDLAREAQELARGYALSAASDIKAAYPRVTGELASGVTVADAPGDISATQAKTTVVNRTWFAKIFEQGTDEPRYTKRSKAHRGVMPAHDVFFPIATRYRNMFRAAMVRLVERAGLKVAA